MLSYADILTTREQFFIRLILFLSSQRNIRPEDDTSQF